MYFKFSIRKHPQTGKLSGYYRLVESYRNAENKIFHRTILNVGFMEDVTPDQLNKIQKQLTRRYEHKEVLFQQEQDDPAVKKYVEELWQRIVVSKKLDLVSVEKLSRMVNMDTLQHSNAREIGAENIAYPTWEEITAYFAAIIPGIYSGASHACRYSSKNLLLMNSRGG